MSLRKLWWWRLRARSHLRPALLMACCFMAFLLLLNKAVVVDRAAPEDLPNILSSGGRASPPPPPPVSPHPSPPTSSTPPSSPELGGEPRLPETAVKSSEEFTKSYKNKFKDFFGTYEDGFENISSEKKNSYKFLMSKIRENTKILREKNLPVSSSKDNKNEPSFGFINDNVRRRSYPQEGNQFMDLVKGFVKGEKAVNPGMLLGAVAALKGAWSFMDTEGSPLKSVMEFARAAKQSIFVKPKEDEGGLPDSQDFLKLEFRSREPENDYPEMNIQRNTSLDGKEMHSNEAKSIKDISLNKKTLSKPSKNLPQKRAFRPTSMKEAMGAMASLFDQGLLGKSSSQSALSSVLTRLIPPLLAGTFSNDESIARPSPDTSNSSPFHSLVSGFGPILLAGIMQQGFGKENADPKNSLNSTKSTPFQSIISKMGPSLLAGAVQAGLGFGETDKKSIAEGNGSNPMQSVLSGLGSALMANLAQGGRNSKKKSNGGPGRLKERPNDGKKLSRNSSVSNKPNSVEPLVDGKKPSVLPEMVQQGPEGGGQAKESGFSGLETLITSMAPLLVAGAMARTVKTQQAKDKVSKTSPGAGYPRNSSSEDLPKAPNDVTGEEKGGVVRLLTRAMLEGLLPEEIPVPEANSTRGAWDMAVNLVLGNPKDVDGKKSQFWKWLREHGGGAEGGVPHTPSWITKALDDNPQRTSYTNEITRLYELLEGQESICKNVKYVGGVFNWKTNVLDGARAVCMDADITPKRENCVVYSFGIKEKWNFEEEMEKMGCEVWAFDPAVRLGNHNHTAHVHFYSLGLAASNTTREVDQQVWNLFTFSAVIGKLGHETTPIDYLKMDIHGDEWQVLQEVMLNSRHALTNVRQLGVEVHLHQALHHPSLYKDYLETLLGLESFGFQLFVSNESQKQDKKYEEPVLKRSVGLSYDLAYLRI